MDHKNLPLDHVILPNYVNISTRENMVLAFWMFKQHSSGATDWSKYACFTDPIKTFPPFWLLRRSPYFKTNHSVFFCPSYKTTKFQSYFLWGICIIAIYQVIIPCHVYESSAHRLDYIFPAEGRPRGFICKSGRLTPPSLAPSPSVILRC